MQESKKKEKKICKYKWYDSISDTIKKCDRLSFDENFCIFHSEDIEGKKAEFVEKFKAEYESQKSQKDKYDFSGFVFPEINFTFDFDKDVSFIYSKFFGNILFYKIQFSGNVKFQTVYFSGDVFFKDCNFKRDANFNYTQFCGDAEFFNTDFRKVSFLETHFLKNVSFYETKFYKETDFSNAEFLKQAYFPEGCFLMEVNSLKMKNTFFYDVFGLFEFIKKNKKNFRYPYIIKCSLKNEKRNDKRKQDKNNKESYKDEKEKHGKDGIGNITRLRRKPLSIKKSLKFSINKTFSITKFLPENFKLILGEKTTARDPVTSREIKDDMYLLILKNKHPIWNVLWWLIADYGRFFFKWIFWSCLLVFVFAYKFIIAYGENPKAFIFASCKMPETIITFFYYSIVTFTTLGFGDVIPATESLRIWVMAEVILGYVMLGGLISILANKLARRS